ncbi:MAG: glycerate kinase, partial [Rhodospirillales bacterium]|nr:glycerate kinase [Rhodospirillales bacterium]
EIITRYGITPPPAVVSLLERAAEETPKPGDPRLSKAETKIVATPQASLEAAARAAEVQGITAHILSDRMEGEARDVALVHAALALQVRDRNQPFTAPCVILSGGETTVTVRGKGRGGRNAEFLLALANALDGAGGIYAVACDTDGIDGTEDNAGAFIGPDFIARTAGLGLNPKASLADNDGYGIFSALGDLIVTGPTLTNINDFRAILVAEK